MSESSTIGYGSMQVFVQTSDGGAAFCRSGTARPMATLCRGPPQVAVTSDASGPWGCGAFTSGGKWFQLRFPECWSDLHITVKELLPIVLGVAI